MQIGMFPWVKIHMQDTLLRPPGAWAQSLPGQGSETFHLLGACKAGP